MNEPRRISITYGESPKGVEEHSRAALDSLSSAPIPRDMRELTAAEAIAKVRAESGCKMWCPLVDSNH
jgi:hypothetical protein